MRTWIPKAWFETHSGGIDQEEVDTDNQEVKGDTDEICVRPKADSPARGSLTG